MKVGIISLYYRSDNYGGNLQAYALTTYLNWAGYQTEQICYSGGIPLLRLITCSELNAAQKIKNAKWKIIEIVKLAKHFFRYLNLLEWKIYGRTKKLRYFNSNMISHSSQVYHVYNFSSTVHAYDTFITGSDQVWNTQWGVRPANFLADIPYSKVKLSYAASLGKSNWTEVELEVHRKYLADFDAISVREEDAVRILSDVAPVPVEWVVDPTLLLTRDDWDALCADPMVDEQYLFCYFLGYDLEERELAKAYAQKMGLKLVNMPFLLKEMLQNKEFRKYEAHFGDKQLYDVSPEQFLSLIKHATCVFTDSFHAALFSGVFEREYFIFGRGEMNSRITSLTKLYETEERFCGTPERRSMDYILAQKSIDYTSELTLLHDMQQKSKDFLKRNLEEAERRINGL